MHLGREISFHYSLHINDMNEIDLPNDMSILGLDSWYIIFAALTDIPSAHKIQVHETADKTISPFVY